MHLDKQQSRECWHLKGCREKVILDQVRFHISHKGALVLIIEKWMDMFWREIRSDIPTYFQIFVNEWLDFQEKSNTAFVYLVLSLSLSPSFHPSFHLYYTALL